MLTLSSFRLVRHAPSRLNHPCDFEIIQQCHGDHFCQQRLLRVTVAADVPHHAHCIDDSISQAAEEVLSERWWMVLYIKAVVLRA